MQHELLTSEIDRLRTRATMLADEAADPEKSLAIAHAAIADLQASVEVLVVTGEELHRQTSELLRTNGVLEAERKRHLLEGRALRDRVAQLRCDEQRKDEFIAMVGHELRNPLAPIRAAVDLWRHHGGQLTELQRDWMVEVVSRQAEHLAYLVDDLLDISRIVHGKIRIEHTNLDLRTIVEDAVTVVRARASHHEVEVELPDQRLPVQGDPIRLRQVFVNLLDNALKFTPKGGSIVIACDVIDGEVRTRVRDQGIGMEAAQLRDVFGLFAQDRRSLHEAGGGLGVGLALVRRIAELHGGTAVARSEGIGCGSELEIRLPFDPRRPTGETITPGSIAALAPLRLLVVDDNVDAAEMLGLLLEADGHTVTLAFTGEDAIAAFASVQPDAVLLDLGLPDLDGFEVGRRLKTVAPALTLLAISGWSDPAVSQKVGDAGFVAHLLKPLELRALQKLLAKVPRSEP